MFEILAGFLIVVILLFDVFQAVLVPRYTPSSLRLAPILISRMAWPLFRSVSKFIHSETLLDLFLGAFAPLVFVVMFSLALVTLGLGYGLIIHGMGAQFHPVITDMGTALYAAGTALLTLGFGDIVATTPQARIVFLLAATTGISVVAIGVSFLFSMQQSVHAREEMVHQLQSRIYPANSAVSLLLNYADLGITDQLASEIQHWEGWIARVLTSHRSFPLLCYFRSGHLSVPWLTIIGVMMDTANLLTTTVKDKRFAHSAYLLHLGCRMVRFFRDYFRLQADTDTFAASHDEFRSAYQLLKERGYTLYDEKSAWQKFQQTRSQYAPALCALSYMFVSVPPAFIASEHKRLADDHLLRMSTRELQITSPLLQSDFSRDKSQPIG